MGASAVLGIQPGIDVFHRQFRLLCICKTADHRPALGIQPQVRLRRIVIADHLTSLRKAPDKAVPIPAQVVQLLPKANLFPLQPSQISRM